MRSDNLLIVGIGASAGGIQAIRQFFEQVPADSGIAFVVILHLSPDHDSQLAQVLQASASLPVTQAQHGVKVEPNHVYVIPPNKKLVLQDGHLALSAMTRAEERRSPVDLFFRTLADAQGSHAVSVVLSGTGANGSLGLKRIKERGGMCLAQDPDQAEYSDMPRNAIATGLVDQILPVADMPRRILAYQSRLNGMPAPEAALDPSDEEARALREIFGLLKARTGHDFTNYKRGTVSRRIARRMVVHDVGTMDAYAQLVRGRPEEAQALLKDLLISVTNFFRDPSDFEALEQQVIPQLFEGRHEEHEIRVWVPGCATGEEAYSIGMLLADHTGARPDRPQIMIFATDIDAGAIAVAREGLYSHTDTSDIPPDRLRRFFVQEGDSYRVRKELRELVLFAPQNILRDPPFSHLDLLSCRNLLIYLNRAAQHRVLEVAHYAIKPSGYLFMGSSESVEGAGDLFVAVNSEARIYQSRGVQNRRAGLPVPEAPLARTEAGPLAPAERPRNHVSAAEVHLRLLEEFAPPSVLVNEHHDLVHLSERAGRYLQFAGGDPSQNLLRIVRPELRIELHSALYRAAQQRTPVDARDIRVSLDDRTAIVDLFVRPVVKDGEPARGYFLVLFMERPEPAGDVAGAPDLPPESDPARHLSEELAGVKAELRGAFERYGTQAEELKASNEELQAMNEELRSSAEELETSREELQSVNEELRTVNQELKITVAEQSQAADDILNLVNSTDIGTIFLDRGLRIKLFTPSVRSVFHLIQSDLGRPLSDIASSLLNADLDADVERVLDRLERLERELETRDGRWLLMRALPYRTTEDRIDGVIITFVDITGRRKSEEDVRRSEEALRQAHGDLERRVIERTQELESANALLDHEVQDRRQAEDRIRGLLGRLITAQEDERRRIARDLHDHLGQQITGLRLRLESMRALAADQHPIADELEKTGRIITQLDHDLDFSTWELRPPTLDDLGIVVALGNFVREWSRTFNVPAEFHSHGLDSVRLTAEIETTLYRIGQEALNNIHKHAAATRVGVLLERRGDEVVLVIEDDGRGFERTASQSGDRGLGLVGMNERGALVGGTLDVETSPGNGTTVFVRVPAMMA